MGIKVLVLTPTYANSLLMRYVGAFSQWTLHNIT